MRSHYLFLVLFLIDLSKSEPCQINNRTDFYRSQSGQCLSCLSYCHHQTSVCLHITQLRHLCSDVYLARNLRECQQKLTPAVVHAFLRNNQSQTDESLGKEDSEPVCLFCGNSTRGLRCESCRPRPNGKQLTQLIDYKTPTSTCFDCSCSGQTYDCQTNVTDGCSCLSYLLDTNLVDLNLYQCLSNRTFTADPDQHQCRSRIHHQCGTCKRGYNGATSERGHRCYKSLPTDTTQCFEYSNSLRSCMNGNEMIRSEDNGTIFFEITPSYRNLNIRVLIGIEEGFVDVICSIRNANFLVLNDHRIFYEHRSLTDDEPIIRDYDLTNEDLNFGVLYSDPSDIVLLRNLSSRHRLTLLISPTNIDFTQDNLRCLLVDQPLSRSRVSDLVDPPSSSSSQSGTFFLSDYRAIHLSTGSPSLSSKTFGYVKVYQSRMNIDLFVFFSVFFSSFFLFLSIGICFWKVKFAYELHRRRRTIKHEYHKRMARPFSKIQLFIKPSTILAAEVEDKSEQLLPNEPTVIGNSIDIPLLLPSTQTDIDYSSHAVALEPLRDQKTCYTTLLFHLPGDLSTQYRLCAGTILTQIPPDYVNALSHARTEAELQKRRRRYRRRNRHQSKVLLKKSTTTSTTTSTGATNASSSQAQAVRRRKVRHPRSEPQPRTTLGP